MPPSDTECACGCGASLRRSPSDYFATEACQRRWTRAQAHIPADADALVGDAMTAGIRTQPPPSIYPLAADGPGVWQAAVRAYRQVIAEEYTAPRPTYTAAPSRWWSYNDRIMMWTLRECDGPEIRDLHRVTDEAARHTPPDMIEDYLRREVGGHIPPLPTRWLQ